MNVSLSGEFDSVSALQRYYRWHSWIYDITRWSFLFGRQALLTHLSRECSPSHIWEIGCGTGSNLIRLARLFPGAELTGLDVSADMLKRARSKTRPIRSRVTLLRQAYSSPLQVRPAPDLIVFSYCLSMIQPGWRQVIEAAWQDLAPKGWVAVVDFHQSSVPAFKRWMACNHVGMEGHLLPALETRFQGRRREVRPAYAGLWQYFIFTGSPNPASV